MTSNSLIGRRGAWEHRRTPWLVILAVSLPSNRCEDVLLIFVWEIWLELLEILKLRSLALTGGKIVGSGNISH